MPRCCLGDDCLFGNLEVRAGHICPDCLKGVHVLCGEEDTTLTLHNNVVCHHCIAKRKSSAGRPLNGMASPSRLPHINDGLTSPGGRVSRSLFPSEDDDDDDLPNEEHDATGTRRKSPRKAQTPPATSTRKSPRKAKSPPGTSTRKSPPRKAKAPAATSRLTNPGKAKAPPTLPGTSTKGATRRKAKTPPPHAPPKRGSPSKTSNAQSSPSKTPNATTKSTKSTKNAANSTNKKAPVVQPTPKRAPVPRAPKKATAVRLSVDKSEQDLLINCSVCFCVDDADKGYGRILLDHYGGIEVLGNSTEVIDEKRYLFGNVVRRAKLPRKGNSNVVAYDINWEDSALPSAVIDLQVVVAARDLSTKMRRYQKRRVSKKSGDRSAGLKYHPSNVLDDDVTEALFQVHEGEDGDPFDSDSSTTNDDDEDSVGLGGDHAAEIPYPVLKRNARDGDMLDDVGDTRTDNTGLHSRLKWRAGQHLPQPRGKCNRGESKVKPEKVNCFKSPLSSFLSFVPLKIFKLMVHYSNLYARDQMTAKDTTTICGAAWLSDISLQEMMTFFGILFQMVLRPTPGQSYISCWDDAGWHPYTQYMRLRRFQQIRSVLHFSDNSHMQSSNDSLFKVRPLLNCLKHTFPSYLDVGDEVALDEASIACRSKYGGFSIFYNPMKPGGKYHFRFYMLCCSSSFACIRLRMHTRDLSDSADGFVPPEQRTSEYVAATTTVPTNADDGGISDEADEGGGTGDNNMLEGGDDDGGGDGTSALSQPETSKLTKLVLDMCTPLYGSGRVVNMDNYYTSPKVAVALRSNKVFLRGTCRSNRKGFPSDIQFSKTEAAKVERGTFKMVSDANNGLAAYGWVDGNPVHFLTSADGTAETEVTRKIGRNKVGVKAPLCIKRYNKGMQAVDRHDQLRQTFSLADRHLFKKYYIKIALGLIDMAVVNAYLHYKLVYPDIQEGTKERTARYEFQEDLAQSFLLTDWSNYGDTDTGRSNEVILRSLVGTATSKQASVSTQGLQNVRLLTLTATGSEPSSQTCIPFSVSRFLHANTRSNKEGLVCQVCRFEERGCRIQSVVMCGRHNLRLCTKSHPFVKLRKKDGSECTMREVLDSC